MIENTRTLTLVKALQRQVADHPQRAAVVADEGELTFEQLWHRSSGVAAALIAGGVVADDVVGVLTDSSLALEIAIWGVLRAGAAYLPLSPEYPTARLAFAVGDSQAVAIVTTLALRSEAKALGAAALTVLCVDDHESADVSSLPPAEETRSDGLAYVIYTSAEVPVSQKVS